MDKLKVERLDHLGVISGVIKDLGLIEMIDERIPRKYSVNPAGCNSSFSGAFPGAVFFWTDPFFFRIVRPCPLLRFLFLRRIVSGWTCVSKPTTGVPCMGVQ